MNPYALKLTQMTTFDLEQHARRMLVQYQLSDVARRNVTAQLVTEFAGRGEGQKLAAILKENHTRENVHG